MNELKKSGRPKSGFLQNLHDLKVGGNKFFPIQPDAPQKWKRTQAGIVANAHQMTRKDRGGGISIRVKKGEEGDVSGVFIWRVA